MNKAIHVDNERTIRVIHKRNLVFTYYGHSFSCHIRISTQGSKWTGAERNAVPVRQMGLYHSSFTSNKFLSFDVYRPIVLWMLQPFYQRSVSLNVPFRALFSPLAYNDAKCLYERKILSLYQLVNYRHAQSLSQLKESPVAGSCIRNYAWNQTTNSSRLLTEIN